MTIHKYDYDYDYKYDYDYDQSWASDNVLASRQRQRDNVLVSNRASGTRKNSKNV